MTAMRYSGPRLGTSAMVRLPALLGVALVLAACAGGPSPTPTKPPAAPAAPSPAAAAASPAAAPAASPGSAPAASPVASPAASVPKPSGPVDKAGLAVGNNLTNVPAFVGVEKGIFFKNGIEMQIKILNSGQEMARALQAGDVEFAGAAVANHPVTREAGIPTVAVVSSMHDATNPRFDDILAVLGRADRGLQAGKSETLVGKKVGTQVGGTPDQYVTVYLKQQGIPRERVEILNMAQGQWQSALQSGNVDAVVAFEPFTTQIQDQVPGVVVVHKGGGLIGYYTFYTTSEQLIKDKPDFVRRFVASIAESQLYIRKNQDEAAEISTRWITGLDLAVAKKAVRNTPFDPRISKYSIQSHDEAVADLIDQKKLRVPIPSSEAFNATFLDQVLRERSDLVADLKPIP